MEETLHYVRFFFATASARISSLFDTIRHRYPLVFGTDYEYADDERSVEEELGRSFVALITRTEDEVRRQVTALAKQCPELNDWTTIDDYYFKWNDLVITARETRQTSSNGEGHDNI